MLGTGYYRGIAWERYTWGLLLYTVDGAGEYRKHRFVGNGSDRVSVVESVARFTEIYPTVELESELV